MIKIRSLAQRRKKVKGKERSAKRGIGRAVADVVKQQSCSIFCENKTKKKEEKIRE